MAAPVELCLVVSRNCRYHRRSRLRPGAQVASRWFASLDPAPAVAIRLAHWVRLFGLDAYARHVKQVRSPGNETRPIAGQQGYLRFRFQSKPQLSDTARNIRAFRPAGGTAASTGPRNKYLSPLAPNWGDTAAELGYRLLRAEVPVVRGVLHAVHNCRCYFLPCLRLARTRPSSFNKCKGHAAYAVSPPAAIRMDREISGRPPKSSACWWGTFVFGTVMALSLLAS
ncbi:hypothetical protein B0T16DRAFT_60919 [Cercophora newfieldiana]|uniref:Uncharacterized protein n=1 Tax=Cercophora newfieldiana TaxID=92897 RepID=A0AA39YRT7_9PEZI|nr:hypothetical protein B0T16DRAFT_60919 [Cercophora newfieldiana]